MREGQAQWCAARLAMAAKALGEIASGEYSIKGEYRRQQAAVEDLRAVERAIYDALDEWEMAE